MAQLKGLIEFYQLGDAGESALNDYFARPVIMESDRDVAFRYGSKTIEFKAGKPYPTNLGMVYALLGDPFARGEFRQHMHYVCRYRFGVHDVPIDLKDIERYERVSRYESAAKVVEPPKSAELPQFTVYDAETSEPIVASWPLYHPDDPELPEPQTVDERLAALEAQLAETQSKRRRRAEDQTPED